MLTQAVPARTGFWKILVCLLLLLSFPETAQAELSRFTLDQLLSKIETRGQSLQTLSCAIEQRRWTDILGEFDEGETGKFYFLKTDDQMYLRKDVQEPQQNTLVVEKGTVLFYQPKIKQVQRYPLGQKKDRAEFLLLGFGSPKQTLQATYDMELTGREPWEDGFVYRLKLVPKSDQVLAFFSEITLWIDPRLWVPVQQKLVEPTQDYLLIRFSDIQINPPLRPADFKLKLPKDVKVVGG